MMREFVRPFVKWAGAQSRLSAWGGGEEEEEEEEEEGEEGEEEDALKMRFVRPRNEIMQTEKVFHKIESRSKGSTCDQKLSLRGPRVAPLRNVLKKNEGGGGGES